MNDLNLFTIAGGPLTALGATLTAAVATLVKTDLDEESAYRLAVLTRELLGRISRPLAQQAE